MSYISLTIKPTNKCNMRCKHCYHAEEGFDDMALPIEEVRKLLDLAVIDYDLIHVLIHGGEPTICGYDYIKKIYDYQKELVGKYGVKFTNTIQTNGLLIDDKWIELFKKNYVNVGISFDGLHNDDLRQYTDIVYSNIQRCKEKGLSIGVLCVETNKSIEKIIDTYKWFNERNISYKILPIFKCGYAKQNEVYLLNSEYYVRKLMELYKYWMHDGNCKIRVNTLEEFSKLFSKNYEMKFGGSCICHRLSINPDGSLYPCGRPYDQTFFLENINHVMSLPVLFQTPGYKKIKAIVKERQKNCMSNCQYFNICKGGCISNSIIDGSYSEIGGSSCVQSRLIFENVANINSEMLCGENVKKIRNPRLLKLLETMK